MSPVSKSVKVLAVGGVAAVAAGIGATQALAGTSTPTPSGTSSTAPAVPAPGADHDGRGPGGRGGRGERAAALAKALGLDQATVQAALESVHQQLRPTTRPAPGTRPSEADRAAHEKAEVAALAKALGVSQARVQAALEQVRAQHEAEHRSELSGRLDAAVTAGKLSSADKASVLKAFDAGVLGGPGR